MNDQLGTAVRTALRDIIATAPIADNRPTQMDLVEEVSERSRRGMYVAVAAAVAITFGVAAILSIETKRSGPDSTPDGRQSGAITDPRSIDLSPWLIGAPEWPGLDPPEYLVFDVAALDGMTNHGESGWHQIADGYSYVWSAYVSDADGHEFRLVISDSITSPRVVTGDAVDINGVGGVASEGEVSWELDGTHTATVTERAPEDNERAVALARQLTTTTVSTISVGGLGGSPEIIVDPSAPFVGVVDGVAWSASATPFSMTFTVDQTVSEPYPSTVEIIQVGGNDLCVFIAGYLPDADTTARLVLSDMTTIALPTQLLEDGTYWFAVCLPYALDVTSVEVDSLTDEPVLHRLNWPLLQPSLGQVATDTDLSTEALAKSLLLEQSANLGCGTTFADQAVMVASTPRADGNRLELWLAPTSTDFSNLLLIALAHNGALLSPSGSCGNTDRNSGFFSYKTDENSVRFIDMVGRTNPNATHALVTFTSGKFVLVDVQTDGYWILSIVDDANYGEYKSVEPVD